MKALHRIIHVSLLLILLTACAGGEDPDPGADIAALPFTESFEDADSCFNLNSGDTSDLRIENGELVMALNTDFGLEWSTCQDLQLDNFTLKLDVYDDSASDDFYFFGVQFRRTPQDGGGFQNYVARIGLGGDGPSACLGLASNNSWVSDLTQSPSGDSCWIEMDAPFHAGEWNHFELTANGPEIRLALNGVEVASASDDRLTWGAFAILLGTHEADAAGFRVDNVRVSGPAE